MADKPFPAQARLFDLLLEAAPNKANWKRQFIERLNLSKSAGYDRIGGKTPITFDEGMALLQAAGLHSNDIVQQPGTVVMTTTPPGKQALDDFLNRLLSDLQALAARPNPQILHQSCNIPFFWLKLNRTLCGFNMYIWERHQHVGKGKDFPDFGPQWLEQPIVQHRLDICRQILDIYAEIPSIEFWDKRMFHLITDQAEYLGQIGAFENDTVGPTIKKETHHLINTLEKWVQQRQKHRDGTLTVYQNHALQDLTEMIGLQAGSGTWYYQCTGFLGYMRNVDYPYVAHCQDRFEQHLYQAHSLTASEWHRRQFFQDMHNLLEGKSGNPLEG